jgi:hypothetical protein
VKAWAGSLDLLPECDLKTRVIARSKAFAEALSNAFSQALPDAFAKAMAYQEPEQEPEQKQKPEQKPKQTSLRSVDKARALLPDLPEQLFQDFVELRKSKRLPITSTAIDGIRNEAGSIGWTLERAINECCVRGWGGFKADWTKGSPPAGAPATDKHSGFASKDYRKGVARDGTII